MVMFPQDELVDTATDRILVRGVLSGIFMGLANLAPGISGGTMLLAAGVYPSVIRGISELSRFRFRVVSLQLMGMIAVAAGAVILLLAGPVRDLVMQHRWVMYSLFIGLTLGGVPLLMGMIRRPSRGTILATTAGVALMLFLALTDPSGSASPAIGGAGILFLAGLVGGASMILPGISGAYLLLLLGQYITILDAINTGVSSLVAGDLPAALDAAGLLLPFFFGLVLGIVGLSHAVQFLLTRQRGITLGFLLGLLLGAGAGLWPFQEPVVPGIGDVIRGMEITTASEAAGVARVDFLTEFYTPSVVRIGLGIGLVLVGFMISLAMGRLGNRDPEKTA